MLLKDKESDSTKPLMKYTLSSVHNLSLNVIDSIMMHM